jgi:hypothetical protein
MRTTTENGDAISRAMDWLGQLREDGYAEPAFDGGGEPVSVAAPHETIAGPAEIVSEPPVSFAGAPETLSRPPVSFAGPAETVPGPSVSFAGPAETVPGPSVSFAGPAETVTGPPMAVPGPPAASPVAMANATDSRSGISESLEIPEPAPIGDELRIPTAWCEMDSCISHYAHPAALGEVDNRSRAISAGWRIDALGRLACPQCQQGPWFWATQPLARWDRSEAVAMATLMTAVVRADDLDETWGEAESTVLPAVERSLVPLPPYDRR